MKFELSIINGRTVFDLVRARRVECIDIVEHYNFNIGNALKYLWRAGMKDDAVEDLKKAAWLINREITRLQKSANPQEVPRASKK